MRSIRKPRVDLVDDADGRAIALIGKLAADDLVEEGIADHHERPVSHGVATRSARPWSPGASPKTAGGRGAKTAICMARRSAAARMKGLGITLL